MSRAQMQRRKRTCEQEKRGVPGSGSLESEIFRSSILDSKSQEHCAAKSVSESLQITLTSSVL